MTTNSTSSLLPSSRAITWHSFVTRLSQILLTCAWSAIASDFKVVVESLRGVRGHQNTPLWLLRQWDLDNNIVPLRERGKGRIGVHGGVSAVSLNWVVSADGLQCETIEGKWDGKNYTVWLLSPAFGPMYPVSRQTWGLGDCMRHNRRIFYLTFYHFFIIAQELDKVLLLSAKSKPASTCYHSVTLPSTVYINS